MLKKINDVMVNYVTYGNESGQDVVFLHGWGQNIAMMLPLSDQFQKEYHVTVIDLPGFGESGLPTSIYTVFDYAVCVKQLLDELKINNPIMVGHSFGGKISLLYASLYPTNKLVVFGSPFDREIKHISLKVRILKALKKVPILNKLENFAKQHIGSTDYRVANPIMRAILTDTVNYDISEEVKKIMCPTLIVWGNKDEAVPLEKAYQLESMIANAGVVVYEGCSHYAYLERLEQTVNVLNSFFSS